MSAPTPEPEPKSPPPYQLATWSVLGLALLLVLGLMSVRTDFQPDRSRAYAPRALPPDAAAVLLPPPPMNDEYVPCSDCHEDEPPNAAVRELEDDHDDMDFQHGDLWCLHCHDLENRDKLHLADRTLVDFEDSWRLCTQCHAQKLADWRAGVHGRRTGHWRGEKKYRSCVSCHDPHAPPFKALEPKPPPLRPTQITLGGNDTGETTDATP